ncbi:nucleoside-diphosphate sugar epimerase [Staphylococcus auricularis]|uniref:NAD-dependent dehydratase n=1 Tax=Staphylococcus auricularis TaxID=29379 RepID=A0AAP8TTT9_9STAP|nr:SDR family oxidoreductase [Staphylococcus auricularis]MDC6326691.1 SDR family oxidoreductase [Staphylococcus auricularis]MDN4532568.1 SDR family oxidoreductase [Staphylococcus auricularis]PNZ68957.1 NAD-dependent dehydratase [Staphylococcus auricularis]QPT05317.1 SDR family oxidoreductase [Staphylococcus auricularis]SQJ11691.1 NADH-flavin reductase [Staphylococcus auricularis]
MRRVLILGANGNISKAAINSFLENTNYTLRLFLRDANRLPDYASDRIRVREGDATNIDDVNDAMQDVDIVVASLSGELDKEAEIIVKAMEQNEVKRLIFVTALGIYNEVPGAFGKWVEDKLGEKLAVYKRAADMIEASDLDYTLLRPAWLTNFNEIDFETTEKDETFKGTEVSRKSVATVIVNIAKDPELFLRENIGINKPKTDGPKPKHGERTFNHE